MWASQICCSTVSIKWLAEREEKSSTSFNCYSKEQLKWKWISWIIMQLHTYESISAAGCSLLGSETMWSHREILRFQSVHLPSCTEYPEDVVKGSFKFLIPFYHTAFYYVLEGSTHSVVQWYRTQFQQAARITFVIKLIKNLWGHTDLHWNMQVISPKEFKTIKRKEYYVLVWSSAIFCNSILYMLVERCQSTKLHSIKTLAHITILEKELKLN
jgi:hypothetical protein